MPPFSTCRACRSGSDLRLPSPRATARCSSPNGIQPNAAPDISRRRPTRCRRRIRLKPGGKPMKDVFARLAHDFFSTIIFLVIYLATDNIVLATSVAIAGAIAQVAYSRIKGQEMGFMTWASLGLVIVLGGATIITNDVSFVLAKPAIGHFAIGAIMLKRGWMLRYMPPLVAETIP